MDENKNFIEGEKVEEVKNTTTNTFNNTNSRTNYRPISEFTVKSKKENKSGFGKQLQFHLFLA